MFLYFCHIDKVSMPKSGHKASQSSKCRIVGKERTQIKRNQLKVEEHRKEGSIHEEMAKEFTPLMSKREERL